MKIVSAREYKYRKVSVGDQVGRLTSLAKVGKRLMGLTYTSAYVFVEIPSRCNPVLLTVD